MSKSHGLAVEIWGARGSMPTPDPGKLGYGGNTTCISVVSAAGERLIIDAGLGIRNLGRALAKPNAPSSEINLLLTHFHWDHIHGLPYFTPLFQRGNRIRFHAFHPPDEIRARVARLMSDPYFPFDFEECQAAREFVQMGPAAVEYGSFTVRSFPLNHPQRAFGYRIESDGAVVVVATDMEHGDATLDAVLRNHIAGADLLIYDAQYTEAEYKTHVGWGHSTPQAAAAFAAASGVKNLLLFHHHPDHDDAQMDQIVSETRVCFPSTTAAREGVTIRL